MNCIPFVLLWFLHFVAAFTNAEEPDRFIEELNIKPLPSGHVYSHFQFTTLVDKSLENREQWRHFHLFPGSLGETLSANHVTELHLSLSQGMWRYPSWGFPTRPSPPGAQLWAWFQDGTENVDLSWKELVNSLSGQFCTSMNFVDRTNTVQPQLSFPAEGAVKASVSSNSSLLRYAALPKENVCTENLTPLKKLLPCDTKAGLAQLLNAVNVLGSSYFSLAVDVRSVCKDSTCTKTYVELRETVSVVFDQLIAQAGKQDWSIQKIFGMSLIKACPVAHSSSIFVDVSSNNTDHPFSLSPEPNHWMTLGDGKIFAMFDVLGELSKNPSLNIKSIYKKNHIHWLHMPTTIHAERYITGYGLEWGGIQCDIHNALDREVRVIYLDILPWFLRVYAHTLTVISNGQISKPDWLQFVPGRDRERPHQLEVILRLAPRSETRVSFQFERAFLKWTEYPPDANHGFYVQSAVITTILSSRERNGTFMLRNSTTLWDSILKVDDAFEEGVIVPLYTASLLVTLPTPDFSMPYNCICLTCTVVALAFGPIHNITTKRLSRVEEQPKKKSIFEKLKSIKNFFMHSKTGEGQDDTNSKKGN